MYNIYYDYIYIIHMNVYSTFECAIHRKRNKVFGGFMESAREMMKDEDGEIHITLNTLNPFNKWDLKALAEEKGLRLIQRMQFIKWAFPSSSNKRASGSNCDFIYPIGSAITYMFKK